MSNNTGTNGLDIHGIQAAQDAASQLVKLSPSMNIQLPAGSEQGDALRLTPFLNSPFATSPWMMPGMDVGFKLSPAMLADQQKSAQAVYKHRSEHNKFQHSFSAALTTDPSGSSSDAEVPQMARIPTNNMPGPAVATTERVVPAPARSRSASRTKAATSGSKKTTKKLASAAASTSNSKSAGSRGVTAKAAAAAKNAAAKRKGRAAPPEESRKEKRREQNRVNAAKCRQRKIDKVTTLQIELEKLHAENTSLKLAYMEMERKLQTCYSK